MGRFTREPAPSASRGDAAGNRTSKADQQTGVTSNFSYDPIYQLTQVTQGATTTESYTYDPVGNRLSSLGMSPYTYNSSNELTSTPTTTYTYDHNGNLKTKVDASGTTTYNWDTYSNRLSSVVLPGTGGTVSFKYDPFGRRIQKSGLSGTTNYLYDGPNLLEEVDNSGNVLARYTSGAGLDQPFAMMRGATTSYYEADGLGSVTSLSNSVGALANTYTYDSFGKLAASGGSLTNPFQYTAREFDAETGTYYYRARYYDSAIGQFVSEDPIRFSAGTNFYRYVNNNPINFKDPSGFQGTNDCSYYQLRCQQSGGNYYCSTAQYWCNKFPKYPDPDPDNPADHFQGWSRCTRKCLQDCDQQQYQNSCKKEKPDPSTDSFWDWKPTSCHVRCYTKCGNDKLFDLSFNLIPYF